MSVENDLDSRDQPLQRRYGGFFCNGGGALVKIIQVPSFSLTNAALKMGRPALRNQEITTATPLLPSHVLRRNSYEAKTPGGAPIAIARSQEKLVRGEDAKTLAYQDLHVSVPVPVCMFRSWWCKVVHVGIQKENK